MNKLVIFNRLEDEDYSKIKTSRLEYFTLIACALVYIILICKEGRLI